jgi:hypothetical protein
MTTETTDARTWGARQYPTALDALTAAYLDLVTAGGVTGLDQALDYAQDSEIEENLRQAAEGGWQWPGNPDLADFHKGAHRTRLELEHRMNEAAKESD